MNSYDECRVTLIPVDMKHLYYKIEFNIERPKLFLSVHDKILQSNTHLKLPLLMFILMTKIRATTGSV